MLSHALCCDCAICLRGGGLIVLVVAKLFLKRHIVSEMEHLGIQLQVGWIVMLDYKKCAM